MELTLSHVSAWYGRSDEKILQDITLHIREGRRLSILGANGCGKTTLLRTMLGLVPSEGEILLNGRELRSMKRREIGADIALMTQLSGSYFDYSVRETVMQGRFLHMKGLLHMPSAADQAAVEDALRVTGLTELADQPITQLSGGQRQRVFLARTFAQDTPILFLDEPTNHLDLKYQAELTEYLLKWSEGSSITPDGREHPHTLVSVFHDLGLALRLSEDVAVLKKGQLLAAGSAAEVLTADLLEEAFGFDVTGYMKRQLDQLNRIT